MYDKYKTIEKKVEGGTESMPLFYTHDKVPHKINTFGDIGMCDPFAYENKRGIIQQ